MCDFIMYLSPNDNFFLQTKFQMTDRLKCCLHQVITHQSSLLENYFKSLMHTYVCVWKLCKRCVAQSGKTFFHVRIVLISLIKYSKRQLQVIDFIQANLCQKLLFLHQLTHTQYAEARCYPKKKMPRFWLQIQRI